LLIDDWLLIWSFKLLLLTGLFTRRLAAGLVADNISGSSAENAENSFTVYSSRRAAKRLVTSPVNSSSLNDHRPQQPVVNQLNVKSAKMPYKLSASSSCSRFFQLVESSENESGASRTGSSQF